MPSRTRARVPARVNGRNTVVIGPVATKLHPATMMTPLNQHDPYLVRPRTLRRWRSRQAVPQSTPTPPSADTDAREGETCRQMGPSASEVGAHFRNEQPDNSAATQKQHPWQSPQHSPTSTCKMNYSLHSPSAHQITSRADVSKPVRMSSPRKSDREASSTINTDAREGETCRQMGPSASEVGAHFRNEQPDNSAATAMDRRQTPHRSPDINKRELAPPGGTPCWGFSQRHGKPPTCRATGIPIDSVAREIVAHTTMVHGPAFGCPRDGCVQPQTVDTVGC